MIWTPGGNLSAEEGVLGHYDLTESVQTGTAATGRDVLTINVDVDRMWGITGGQFCALRLPDGDTSSIIWIDIHACEGVHEVSGRSPSAWVDAELGRIVEIARSGDIVERGPDGKEVRVLRNLPDGEWIAFDWNGILGNSKGAANVI